ncbi:MAG: dephospho-CoA kinase [Fibrobacter sp.]|nr:dephospho-CoA kinase [Fibrobacter sp.]
MADKRIGITGTIGSGKSTVGECLRRQGLPVLDADACVHELYRDCEALRKELAEAFGPECLTADGVNRKFFADLIFKDDAAREKLEALVYPYLTDAVQEFFASHSVPAFLEAALLHRIPQVVKLLDQVWLVDAPAKVRLERLVSRGLARGDAERRIETQGDIVAFAAVWQAQGITVTRIENGGSLEQLEELVHQLSLS